MHDHNVGKSFSTSSICLILHREPGVVHTNVSFQAPCVVFYVYVVPFCVCLEIQVKKSSISVILSLLLSLPISIALPPPHPTLQSLLNQNVSGRLA